MINVSVASRNAPKGEVELWPLDRAENYFSQTRSAVSSLQRAPWQLARRVKDQHLIVWRRLSHEALRAREAYLFSARGAAVANFRGQTQRSERLTRLAYKQRTRWFEASRALELYEN